MNAINYDAFLRLTDLPAQHRLRFLLGMTNGIVITARTSLRELCGREYVVKGMVYFGGKTRTLGVLDVGD